MLHFVKWDEELTQYNFHVNGEIYDGSRLDGYQVRCIKSDNGALTLGTKVEATLDAGGVIWYSFDATQDSDYQILTEDIDNNSSSYPADITVSVYRADKSTPYTYSYDANGTTYGDFVLTDIFDYDGLYIKALASEKVMIKIEGYSSFSNGLFSLKVQ